MNFRKRAGDASLDFQMTPMIDLMFLLLCFFLVVYVYSQWETRLDLKPPVADNSTQSVREPTEIIINIDKEGTIYINHNTRTLKEVEGILMEIKKTDGSGRIIIRCDGETNWEKGVELMNVCTKAGMTNIAIATLPEEGGQK